MACDFDNSLSVSNCFDRVVEQHGSSIAVHDYSNNVSITYHQLQQQVKTLAQNLISRLFNEESSRNIGYGVVLCVEEGPEMIMLVMALGSIGAFYVPVELNKTPSQRVAYIAKDCGAKVCIGWNQDKDRLPHSLDFVSVEELLGNRVALFQELGPVEPTRPLYAIYTSGSTGEPKGVMMTHKNLIIYSQMKGLDEFISHECKSRVLLASAFTFDLCEGDIYTTLLNGATLVTAPRSSLLHDLRSVLMNTKSTHITLTPSLFGLLDANNQENNTSDTVAQNGPLSLPYLQSVCLGGEPMSVKMIKAWGTNPEKHKLTLRNLYGATEATVHQTRATIYPDSRPNDIGIPIGYNYSTSLNVNSDVAMGLNGVGVFLALDWFEGSSLDEQSFTIIPPPLLPSITEVAVKVTSEPGELVIFGPTVANSYLNRPDLSAQKFSVTARFGNVFRTGDMGMWIVTRCDSGEIEAHFELMGRMEEGLVKINGQRVELGEVVTVLETSNIVKKAVVLKLPRDGDSNTVSVEKEGREVGDNLLAVLVLSEGEVLDEHSINALRSLCEIKLPLHMIPRRFARLPSISQFPLTSSGKVDPRKLTQCVQHVLRESLEKGYGESCQEETIHRCDIHVFSHAVSEPLVNDLEMCIAKVWEQVLGLEAGSVGRFDSFALLGGDSLAALRASRLLSSKVSYSNGQMNSERYDVAQNTIGNEHGLVDGEAALFVNDRSDGEACMFGVTMGPLAPCELEKHAVLFDYAQFLSNHDIQSTTVSIGNKETLDGKHNQANSSVSTPILRALCSSITSGRIVLLETLLQVEAEKDSSLTLAKDAMFSPLHAAASSTHSNAVDMMRMITSHQCGPRWMNKRTEAGTSPLHLCAARGDLSGRQMASLLIEASADVLAVDADLCTTLILASRAGDEELCAIFLEWCERVDEANTSVDPHTTPCKQSFLNRADRWGRTALDWSMLNSHHAVSKLLRSHGAVLSNGSSAQLEPLSSHEPSVEKSAKRAHGSSDPAHVSRKLSSDVDTIASLVSTIQTYKQSTEVNEVAIMEMAISTIRNLVCTSNINREGARQQGVIPELVHVIHRYMKDKSSSQLKVTIAAVGVLRNLSYGNETNRIAIVDAGGVSVLLGLLPTTDEVQAVEGEDRNLAFTTASALCNIAMSTYSHSFFLMDNLLIIQAVLGFDPTKCSQVDTSPTALPHPGLLRLRESFFEEGVINQSNSSRYSELRQRKQANGEDAIQRVLSMLSHCLNLDAESEPVDEEDTLLEELEGFIVLVKSNNKMRTRAGQAGVIANLIILLDQQLNLHFHKKYSLWLKVIESLTVLSYGNDENRLRMLNQGGILSLSRCLQVIDSQPSTSLIDNQDLRQKIQITTASVLCNVAMNSTTHEHILSEPAIVVLLKQLKGQGFNHPGLSKLEIKV